MNRGGVGFRPKQPPIRFSSEILSMMALFGCPNSNNMESTAKSMEQYIRMALIALISRAKSVAQRRGSANSKPTPRDYLFCLKDTPALVARLSTYLSFKEVRRRHRDADESNMFEGIEEGDIQSIASGSSLDKLKQQQLKLKPSWDFTHTLAEALAYFDDAKEESLGHSEWKERLQSMDEITESMSTEEYRAFSESRLSSFSYKKTKKFKDFIACVDHSILYTERELILATGRYHTLLDVQPSEEIVDILSFLAYELVGYYTRIAKAQRDLELERAAQKTTLATTDRSPSPSKRQRSASPAATAIRTPVEMQKTKSGRLFTEQPTGPFSMPIERLPDKSKSAASGALAGGASSNDKDPHPILPEHVSVAIKSHGMGLGLITPKSNGYGFGNFGGPAKRRKLV